MEEGEDGDGDDAYDYDCEASDGNVVSAEGDDASSVVFAACMDGEEEVEVD